MNALTKGFTGAPNHTSARDHESGASIGVSVRNHCLAIVAFIGFIPLYFDSPVGEPHGGDFFCAQHPNVLNR